MSCVLKRALAASAVAALLAGSAFAQQLPAVTPSPVDPAPVGLDPPPLASEPPPEVVILNGPFITNQAANEVMATDFLGRPVFNRAAETLGTISNLLFSRDEGRLTGIVVGVGGFLGIGQKSVAISILSLEVLTGEDGEIRMVADIERSALEAAPDFRSLAEQEADLPPQPEPPDVPPPTPAVQ